MKPIPSPYLSLLPPLHNSRLQPFTSLRPLQRPPPDSGGISHRRDSKEISSQARSYIGRKKAFSRNCSFLTLLSIILWRNPFLPPFPLATSLDRLRDRLRGIMALGGRMPPALLLRPGHYSSRRERRKRKYRERHPSHQHSAPALPPATHKGAG